MRVCFRCRPTSIDRLELSTWVEFYVPRLIAALVTELLQLQVPDYETVYHRISEMRTYRTVGSGVTSFSFG